MAFWWPFSPYEPWLDLYTIRGKVPLKSTYSKMHTSTLIRSSSTSTRSLKLRFGIKISAKNSTFWLEIAQNSKNKMILAWPHLGQDNVVFGEVTGIWNLHHEFGPLFESTNLKCALKSRLDLHLMNSKALKMNSIYRRHLSNKHSGLKIVLSDEIIIQFEQMTSEYT